MNDFSKYPGSSREASLQLQQHSIKKEGESSRRAFLSKTENAFPLSFAQQRLWLLDQLAPDMPTYNIPVCVRLTGVLNVAILEQSLNHIVQRHDVLRTTFVTSEGRPLQVIAPSMNLALSMVDLQEIPESEQDTKVESLVTQEAHRPFDLAQGPLVRAVLFRLNDRTHVFLLIMHHIISDGWSISVLFQELTLLYEAFSAGKRVPLSPLPKQYIDYATWQRTWLQGDTLQELLTYWKQQLNNAPAMLQLPTDRPRPAVQTFRGARHIFQLSQELTASLKELSREEGATLFMILLAAFQVLLCRYTGQNDILVGTPIAGRMQGDVEDLIGFFVNTLVLRTKLSESQTFREILRSVRATALEAYTYQDLPFERLVEEVQPGRDASHNPLFQVLFVLQNTPPKNAKLQDIDLSFLDVERTTAKFDLTLEMQETADGICGNFEYSRDLFDAPTIGRMCGHLQVLLTSIAIAPEQRVDELPLLTEAERQLLVEWNNTGTEYPRDQCVHQLFEAQVERTPDAVAVVCGEERLTYTQLNEQTDQVAHYLQSLGVGPGMLVGLCMERSLEMIVGLLSILKAGGAYVPLDPTYPQERLAFMLADSEVSVLLTQQRLLARLPPTHAHLVCLDTQRHMMVRQPTGPLSRNVTPKNLAYVIYTSGSTGKPKGVCVTHQNVVRLVKEANYFTVSEDEVFLQFAPISFDASTFEIWGCLLNGARLIVFPAYTPSLEELGCALEHYHITTLWLTTGLFHQMVESQLEKLSRVRQVLAGGDILSVVHVQKALQAGCRIINGYGPTESTTFTCCHSVLSPDDLLSSVPIGRPISNTQVYLLDSHLQSVPIGVPGELYIGGDGLAFGYHHRPELTADRFIAHPFSNEPNARLYRTGDLARYLPNGVIEFLGRNDRQVKIRGFRIELGEIEAVLSQHPGVQEVCVLVHEDHPGEKHLIAYIVQNKSLTTTRGDLQRYSQLQLPDYMIPAAFVIVDAFPLTPNGKVDRDALPPPDCLDSEGETPFMAPRNTLEARIALVFEEVLDLHPVSVKSNFFALGGHSLSAMRLLSRLHKLFDYPISLSSFFREATVESIADLLRRRDSSRYSPLVGIQSRGSNPSLCCVHPADGDIFCYIDLAKHLGPDQPFFAFEEPFLEEEWLPGVRVDEMALRYIEVLRDFQPNGPYFLGGWSFGGIVAFEMACRLHEQGQKVALVALLDTPAPLSVNRPEDEDDTAIIAWSARALAKRGVNLPGEQLPPLLSEDALRQLTDDEQWNYLAEVAKGMHYVSPDDGLAQVRRWIQHYKNHVRATQTYTPQGIYPSPLSLFRAEKTFEYLQRISSANDETLGWKEFSSKPVEVYSLPGDHGSITRDPHVRALAECLRHCIQRARGNE